MTLSDYHFKTFFFAIPNTVWVMPRGVNAIIRNTKGFVNLSHVRAFRPTGVQCPIIYIPLNICYAVISCPLYLFRWNCKTSIVANGRWTDVGRVYNVQLISDDFFRGFSFMTLFRVGVFGALNSERMWTFSLIIKPLNHDHKPVSGGQNLCYNYNYTYSISEYPLG